MNKFKNAMYNFLQGIYGVDALHKFLFVVFIIIWILNSFIKSTFLYLLGMIVCIFMFYRFFSRDIWKRQNENRKYLEIKNKVISNLKLSKRKWNDRKTHIYRKCPECKAEIRLPRKKGKHKCTCPCCKKDFDVKCYS